MQLENVVRSAALTAIAMRSRSMRRSDPPGELAERRLRSWNRHPGFELAARPATAQRRDAFERVYFEHHLAIESSNMRRVRRRASGSSAPTLYRKLKQLGSASPSGRRVERDRGRSVHDLARWMIHA